MKIVIIGLPGSGKTTLAEALSKELKAVHWNADAVRQNINDDLGFSVEDRLKQAYRMGWLCDQVKKANQVAIADFVCPTKAARDQFGECDLKIWMNTIKEGRYEDTNRLFEPPTDADIIITKFQPVEIFVQIVVDYLKQK